MAETEINGKRITASPPARLTQERRAELERFRWYNTSLDEAMAELERVECRVAKAVELLKNARHYVGVEGDLIEELRETLKGDP